MALSSLSKDQASTIGETTFLELIGKLYDEGLEEKEIVPAIRRLSDEGRIKRVIGNAPEKWDE